ncbi:alanine racemase [Paenibacillus sp. GCM10027626]|uniref:alanine racemase n=1 Tax=Paenibacillus sp. GCM10027626 TaxID=3273411 RepID=UPI003641ECDB
MHKGYRDTWAEIDLAAIRHNVHEFRCRMAASCRFMAVVKADGYGHGAVEAAKAALDAGADYLGVALIDEALELRRAGIAAPILALGYTPPRAAAIAVEHQITLTVYSEDVLDELIRCSAAQQREAKVHLKVDTGMSRIGTTNIKQLLALAERIGDCPRIQLEGIFTHFAEADAGDSPFTTEQFRRFMAAVETLRAHGIEIPLKHCCNSAAAIHFPDMHLDMVRVGISLYGLLPSRAMSVPFLRQAMHFKSCITMVKAVEAGVTVGYGRNYTAAGEGGRMIATIAAGYADGLSRSLSNRGSVLVHGQRAPVAGNVCMDQTMLDVTGIADVKTGDEATIFGADGERFISVDELAIAMNTINYEVVCLIGKRVPRLYRNGS